MSIPSLFISSSHEGTHVAKALAAQLAAVADCNIWAAGPFDPGRTIIESLSEAAERADFAVLVLTPDDVTHSRGQEFQSPRDNLIFELGFLAGQIGINRTIAVVVGSPPALKLPTDLSGIINLRIDVEPKVGDLTGEPALMRAAIGIQNAMRNLGNRAETKRGDFFSCFISYSWNDQLFATRLHQDLQSVGVRVWYDVNDMSAGETIDQQVDRAIQAHDKVLLVLSESSIKSEWVRTEINNALELEQARNQTVLFPVRLDDAVLNVSEPAIDRLREKYILDFNDWQDDRVYKSAFSRLVRDLAINSSVESGGRE